MKKWYYAQITVWIYQKRSKKKLQDFRNMRSKKKKCNKSGEKKTWMERVVTEHEGNKRTSGTYSVQ